MSHFRSYACLRGSQTPRGMTLVEMLVVLALLAVMSGMVVSLTDNMDQRDRYNTSAARLTEVRSAILGPDAISADGALLSGGYLQDVGALPLSGSDLIRCPDVVQTYMVAQFPNKEPYQYDSIWHTWFGWRGPYVNRLPLRKDESEITPLPPGKRVPLLYDGWGNDYSGWVAQANGVGFDYMVQSLGAHGIAGGTGVFDKKYPDDSQPLIRATEWQTPDLSGRLQITVINLTPQTLADWTSVRFRIVIPDFSRASGPLSANVTTDAGISLITNLSTIGPPNDLTNPNRQTFTFTSNVSGGLRMPMGHRTLIVVDGATGLPKTTTNGINVTAFTEIPLSKKLSTTSIILYVQVAP